MNGLVALPDNTWPKAFGDLHSHPSSGMTSMTLTDTDSPGIKILAVFSLTDPLYYIYFSSLRNNLSDPTDYCHFDIFQGHGPGED